MDGGTLMQKILLASLIVGFAMMATGCEKKTTSEKLQENISKDAELIEESVSENAEKVGDAIQKGIDDLKK